MLRKDFITIGELSVEELEEIFAIAQDMKANPGRYGEALKGKTLALIFEKPSTRTRVAFEVAMYQLGGLGLYLGASELQLGRGETISDTARVLSSFVDGIAARVYAHESLLDLARAATVPVINGLSDLHHPCQAVADLFTLRERRGELRGLKMAYVGDGNNIAHSLIEAAAKVGLHICIATPPRYEPKRTIVEAARKEAKRSGARIELSHDPTRAVKGADVVYTDVWVSMGQEDEAKRRMRAFRGYQVNSKLFAKAKRNAFFMHCLPAHRGLEVTDDVIDSQRSLVFDQAANRLHTQKALLYLLLGGR